MRNRTCETALWRRLTNTILDVVFNIGLHFALAACPRPGDARRNAVEEAIVKLFERYGLAFVRFYLGGFYLVSGLNYFLLFQLAKVVEAVGGFLLFFNISVPFGLVLLFPITATVMIMNFFFSDLMHVRLSGMRNFVLHLILFAGYAGYYLPMLNLRAAPRPLWRELGSVKSSILSPSQGALQNG
jgi:hypothetical protein